MFVFYATTFICLATKYFSCPINVQMRHWLVEKWYSCKVLKQQSKYLYLFVS